MGVERRAPPNPLRASSEKADGSGSILIDTTAAQLTITAPAQTPGLHCNKTLFFSFLFHLPFFFQTPTHPHLVEWFLSLLPHRCRGTRPLLGDPDLPGSEPRDPATRRAHGGDEPDAAEPRLFRVYPLECDQSTRGSPKEVRELPGQNSCRELGVIAGIALPIPGRPTYSGRGSRRGRRWRGRGLEKVKPFSSALPRQRRRAA